MNSSFINRLVGTSIVVVAAIVFIPNILDGEKIHHNESFPAIADKPEFATIDLQNEVNAQADLAQLPSQPEIHNEQAIDEDNAKYQESITALPEEENIQDSVTSETENSVKEEAKTEVVALEQVNPVSLNSESVSKGTNRNPNLDKTAYVIQLGSFSHKPNVDALQGKLREAGFDTFTRPVATKNGTLTKVFVGPTTDKKALESKLPELKKLTKLNGRITEFEPAK